MVRISSRYKKIPTVTVQARNRKTGANATRTYEGTTPTKVIEALDRVMLNESQQPCRACIAKAKAEIIPASPRCEPVAKHIDADGTVSNVHLS